MPTIEQGHSSSRHLPRAFVSECDYRSNFKEDARFERPAAVRSYFWSSIGMLVCILYTGAAIGVTVYVFIATDVGLAGSIGIFLLWFTWLLCSVFFVYGLMYLIVFTRAFVRYKNEKRKSKHNWNVVAQTTTTVVANTVPDATRDTKGDTTVLYSSGLKKYVDSMAGVFLGRQSSADFRNAIISGKGLEPTNSITELPITVLDHPQGNLIQTPPNELTEKNDAEPVQIHIVVEGTSSEKDQPQVLEETNSEQETPQK
jgi:membrane protein implicated in regulation of membrane protease activity